jgi:hypothetical protein
MKSRLNSGDTWYHHAAENRLPCTINKCKDEGAQSNNSLALYRHEVWSVAWGDEHGLVLSEKSMLRKDGWM